MTSSLPRQFESRDGRTATGLVVLLAVCLVALLAGAGEYLLAQSFEPSSPAKEYVYVGGRLVAVEVLDPTTIPPTIGITPTSTSLGPQQQETFVAILNPLDNPPGTHPVRWGIDEPALGKIKQDGTYTPPENMSGSDTVRVTSLLDQSQFATASVTFNTTDPGPVLVTVTGIQGPPPDLLPGQTYDFQVQESPAADPPITWKWTPVPEGRGLVTPLTATTARYTAPPSISVAETIQIRAEDELNSGTFGEISVNLIPPVVPDGPDLVVTHLTGFSSSVSSGGSPGTATITIQNVGNEAAPESNYAVKFCTSQNEADCEDSNLAGGTIDALAVDESVVVPNVFLGGVPFQETGGTYYLAGVADSGPTLNVIEQDETNNYLFEQVTVQDPVPGNPDLVVTSVGTYPSAVPPGGTIITQNLWVRNDGGGVAQGTSFGIDVALYQSTDNNLTTSDTLRRRCHEAFRDLYGQEIIVCQPVVTSPSFPAPTTVGTYYLGAIVDWTEELAEGSLGETNNTTLVKRSTGQTDGLLLVTHEANFPDLRTISMTVPPTAEVGETVNVVAETTHLYNGMALSSGLQITAEAPLQVAFFLTADLTGGLAESEARLLGTCAIVTDLDSGDEDTCNLNTTIPEDLEQGQYAVWGHSDDTGKYPEFNEFNNYLEGGQITVTAPTTAVPQALDSGFETSTLNHWAPVGTVTPALSTAQAYNGTQSLILTGGEGGAVQFVTGLTVGTMYRVRAKARAAAGTLAEAKLRVGDPAIVEDGPRTLSDASFQEFSVEFTAALGTIPVHLERESGGAVYWDEVWVELANPVATPQPVNAGFETAFAFDPDPYPWILENGASTASLSTAEKKSGASSLQLSGEIFHDVAGLRPGQRYEVRAWAKAGSGDTVLTVDDRVDRNVEEMRLTGTDAFEEFAVVFTASVTGAARIHLSSTDTSFWDDVVIVESKAPQPANDAFDSVSASVLPWVGGVQSDLTGRSGTASLSLGSGQSSTQTVTGFTVGQGYKLVVWAQSAGSGSAKLAVTNGAGVIAETTAASVSNSEFEMLSLSFVAPESAITMELETDTGTVHWDDVTIVPTAFTGPGLILPVSYSGADAATLAHVDLVINAVSGGERCWVRYDNAAETFSLIGNDTDNTTVVGTLTALEQDSLTNNRCTLHGNQSAATLKAGELSLQVQLQFAAPMVADVDAWVHAQDSQDVNHVGYERLTIQETQ